MSIYNREADSIASDKIQTTPKVITNENYITLNNTSKHIDNFASHYKYT